MRQARRMGWWIAVPIGIALGLALAVGLDRAATPAGAQSGGAGFTVSPGQLKINQRISQAGVKRSNRANTRLDALTPAATGPAGPAGPTGPQGPGATRIAYSAAQGSPAQTILDQPGLALSAVCQAGPGAGESSIALTATVPAGTTFIGTSTTDAGTDPENPMTTATNNFSNALAAGSNPLGGPVAPEGDFARSVSMVIFIGPSRTYSLNIGAVVDAAADRCSFNGTAVPA